MFYSARAGILQRGQPVSPGPYLAFAGKTPVGWSFASLSETVVGRKRAGRSERRAGSAVHLQP